MLIGMTSAWPVSGSLTTATVMGTGDLGGGVAPSALHMYLLSDHPRTSMAGHRELDAKASMLSPAPTPAPGSKTN
eukprot:scaffold148766_cov36-Tisochrysis_lutea.AAC.2